MSDKEFTADLRTRTEVSAEEKLAAEKDKTAEEKRPGVLFPSDPDEDLYTFQQGITFYDLGTRRTEDGSYVEVEYGSFTVAEFDNLNQRINLLNLYHNAFLSGEYDKARSCLKLPQESAGLYVDAVFKRTDNDEGEEERKIIGQANARPFMRDYPLAEGGVILPPEPELVAESDWRGAKFKFSKAGEWGLEVESGFHYNPFDTTKPEKFRVNTSPDPTAILASEHVELDFSKQTKTRVYLTPRLTWHGLSDGGAATYTMCRYLPVLPDFDYWLAQPRLTRIGFDLMLFELFEAWATEELWAMLIPYYHSKGMTPGNINAATWWTAADSLTDFWLMTQFDGVPHEGVLAAVVVQGGKTYYVWEIDWHSGITYEGVRIFNPEYIHGVGVPA